jgi:hypothetical protein
VTAGSKKKQFDSKKKNVVEFKVKKRNIMRIQGIEPWSVPWEGTMIPLHQMRFDGNNAQSKLHVNLLQDQGKGPMKLNLS